MGKEHEESLDAEILAMESALMKPGQEPDLNTEATELADQTETNDLENTDADADADAEGLEAESEGTENVDTVTEPQPDLTETEEEPKAQTRVNWKKRYSTNKQASDITIHSQRVELAATGRQLTESLTENETLRKALAKAVASKPDKPVEEMFTEKEREVLGDDALMAMTRVTKERIAEATKPLEERLAAEAEARRKGVEERADSVAIQAADQFRVSLAARVPNLDVIDVDPKFSEWLGETDEAGQERMRLFRVAQQNSDVVRVAQFFNEFAAKTAKPASKIESQITPEGNSSAPADESSSGEQPSKITRSFIDKFYGDVRTGKYKGKDKLQTQTEAMIDKAVQKSMQSGVPLPS